MAVLAYNYSISIKDSLQKIELLRRQILLTPLSPKTELRLRWEAMLNRIYWSLSLAGNELNKTQIIKLLTVQSKKRPNSQEQEVIKYKRALDWISQEWLVSYQPITPKIVIILHELACSGRLQKSEQDLKQFLDYLQISKEDPVIQAGIAQAQIITLSPFAEGNGRTARLLALLFLYKAGYDFRGFLCLEEYWRRDLKGLTATTTSIAQTGNLTGWLEYFTNTALHQLEKAVQDLTSTSFQVELPSVFWRLNDRQKAILSLLEQPNSTITNKKVQKLFKVSQITASRNLVKLVSLGLLFTHGKGRSVNYTKV